ncbi:MAG TPA: LytTR family DNA-binding domain-containing protein [Phnomibacter sp.]|nr:LytTR family DNA-binding domain-containing protein [Phnomibacter sp.]
MKAIIIDDEPNLRKHTRYMVEQHFSWLTIVGEGNNVQEGIELFNSLEPDLLLLDIQLRGGETGFDLLTAIGQRRYQVIFITAYDEFMMRAFRFAAVDYLLKPLSKPELEVALNRAYERYQLETGVPMIEGITDFLKETKKSKLKLTVAQRNTYLRIPILRIQYMVAINHCVELTLDDGNKILTTRTLGDLQETLEPYDFIRTHQKCLANKDYVVKLEKEGSAGRVVMLGGDKLPVARVNYVYVKAELHK